VYLLVRAKRYGGRIPCIVQGHVSAIARQLAGFARSNASGRISDSILDIYAKEYEEILRRDAENPATKELVLEAHADPFKVGINAGSSLKVGVPVVVLDVLDGLSSLSVGYII